KVRQEELGRGGGGEVEDGDQQINPIQSVITSAQEISLSQESPRTFVSRLVAWMRGRFSTDRTFSNREKLASLQAKRITTFPPFPTLYTVTLSDNTRNVFKVFEKQPLNDPRELFGNSLQAWGFVGAHREELASEMADILNLSDIFGYNPVPTAVRRTEVINAKEWAGVLTPFINKASEADFSFGTSIDSRQKQAIMWFDFLLGNTDRDWRNILLVPNPNDRKRPQVYLIDHAAAFAPGIDGYDSSNVLRLSPSEEINSEIFDHFKTILSDKEKIQEIAGRFDRAIVQATDPVTRALLQEAKDGFMRRVEILLKTTNAFPQPVETSWKDANIGVVNAFTALFYPEFARQSPDEQQKQYDLRTVLVREAGIRLGEGDDKRSVDEIVSEINSKLRYGLVVTEAQKTDLNRSKSSYINLLLEVQKEELGTGGGGGTVFGAGLGGFGQLLGAVLDVGSDVTGFFAELIGPETTVGRRLESLSRSLFRQSVAMNPPFVGLSAGKTSTVEPPAWYLEVLPSDQKQSTEADMPEIDGSRFGDRKEDVESSARVLRSFLAAPLIQDYFERDGSKTERGTRLYWLEQMYQKLKRDRGEAAAEGFYQWYRSNRFNRETLDPVLPAVLKLEGVLSIELIERSKELAARLGEYDELPISDRFRVVFDTTKLVRDALRYLATGQFPPAKPGDVTLVREQFYKELQQKVVQAFVTRPVQHSNPLFGQTDEQMRQSQKIADEYIGLPDNAVIHISGTTGPGEVFIDDSHDYPTLLRMALLVVEYPERFIEDVIQKTLEHEFDHAVPGLGQEGVKIRYGIEFSKDPDTGATLITPMVKPVGDISVGLYKDMISAPKVLSFSDRAGLGLPFGPQEPTKPEVVVREPIKPPAESTQPSLEESGDTGSGGEVEEGAQSPQSLFIDSLITALNGIDLPDAANGVSRLEQLQTRTHPFKGNPLRGNRELGLTDETIAAKENRSIVVEAMDYVEAYWSALRTIQPLLANNNEQVAVQVQQKIETLEKELDGMNKFLQETKVNSSGATSPADYQFLTSYGYIPEVRNQGNLAEEVANRMEEIFTYQWGGKELGCREGACGFGSARTLDELQKRGVHGELYQVVELQIAAAGDKNIPSGSPYHGVAIYYVNDPNDQHFGEFIWSDHTFKQFVNEQGVIQGSGIQIDDPDDPRAATARELLEKHYIALTPEKLRLILSLFRKPNSPVDPAADLSILSPNYTTFYETSMSPEWIVDLDAYLGQETREDAQPSVQDALREDSGQAVQAPATQKSPEEINIGLGDPIMQQKLVEAVEQASVELQGTLGEVADLKLPIMPRHFLVLRASTMPRNFRTQHIRFIAL
ncbi:MAG: hypothetical protein UY16_C0006G0001, partial [Candidatus Gottesmanbacteria bacterium GW2011_GWA2_47_9]